MGERYGERRRIPERREFLKRLEGHGAVVTVEFTRDGFRTVFVEVAPGERLDGELRREAERLGYDIEPPGTAEHRRWRLAEWWEGAHGSVRVLGLDDDQERSASKPEP